MDNSAILSLFAPPKIDGVKKILCVQPHPDDNEIGMGGNNLSSNKKRSPS